MNMLTQDSIKAALNREIAEEILVVAKLAVNGMDEESIAQILGSTKEEVRELFDSQDYKDVRLLVGVEHARLRAGNDHTWDGIENTALEGLSKRVHLERDTDTLLRIAAVANKAQRRLSQSTQHVLDPANAQTRVPLKLTKRFTEKINSEGQVVERSETQEVSVVNGTAKTPSFESINEIFAIRGNPAAHAPAPKTHDGTPMTNGQLNPPVPKASRAISNQTELERFLAGMPDEQ